MSEINQRIRQLIQEMGMNNSSFGKKISVKYQTLYNSVGPRDTQPSSETLSAILNAFPHVRAGWLMKGDLPMFYDNGQKRAPINAVGESLLVQEQETAYDLPDKDREDAIPFVPITAEGSYLSGFADDEYMEHLPKFYLPFLGLGAGVYAFQVRGDSMSDRFNNGDVVFGQLVNKHDALRWGEVYVLLCNDGLVVKELRRGPDDKHFTLRSYNEHFDPYEVLKTEVRAMYRYQASISFNSSNPNRSSVMNFLQQLSQQMADVQSSVANLPQAK